MAFVRPWTVMAAAPFSSAARASATALGQLRSQPRRVFTVTGTETASATARMMRPANGMSRMRALPSPLLAIFGMGQPILMSRKSHLLMPTAICAASAIMAGSLPKICAPHSEPSFRRSRPRLLRS